jgi:two-component system CheB/CheR fusion protein
VREPLLVLDTNLRIQRANKAFYQTLKVTQEETINQSFFELGNGQWNINGLRILLEEILGNCTSFENYEVTHELPHIGYRKMLVNARIINEQDQVKSILMTIEDVTSVEKR